MNWYGCTETQRVKGGGRKEENAETFNRKTGETPLNRNGWNRKRKNYGNVGRDGCRV